MRVLHRFSVLVLAGLFTAAANMGVLADVGAGVGASPIRLSSPAHPGNAYRLPALYVVNTGTVASRYHISVERLKPGPALTAPTIWIEIGRNDFTLAPGRSINVPLTLTVPVDAATGNYASDLVAGTEAPAQSGKAATASARAATELLFTVAPGDPLLIVALSWWTYALAGAAVLIVLAFWAQRRYGFTVSVERRSSSAQRRSRR